MFGFKILEALYGGILVIGIYFLYLFIFRYWLVRVFFEKVDLENVVSDCYGDVF